MIANQIGKESAGEDPDQAQSDHQSTEQGAKQQQMVKLIVVKPIQNIGQLQSNQNKHQAVQDKAQRIPNCPCLYTHAGRKEFGTSAAKIKSANHYCQYSRGVNLFRHE